MQRCALSPRLYLYVHLALCLIVDVHLSVMSRAQSEGLVSICFQPRRQDQTRVRAGRQAEEASRHGLRQDGDDRAVQPEDQAAATQRARARMLRNP